MRDTLSVQTTNSARLQNTVWSCNGEAHQLSVYSQISSLPPSSLKPAAQWRRQEIAPLGGCNERTHAPLQTTTAIQIDETVQHAPHCAHNTSVSQKYTFECSTFTVPSSTAELKPPPPCTECCVLVYGSVGPQQHTHQVWSRSASFTVCIYNCYLSHWGV